MYKKILVALDHTGADNSLLPHITELARLAGSELVLLHVTTGWISYWGRHLKTDESAETREDEAYLLDVTQRLTAEGFQVRSLLAIGQPHQEILNIAQAEGCDLIAMTTHGHRFLYDIVVGSTIEKVRHASQIPILIVRAEQL